MGVAVVVDHVTTAASGVSFEVAVTVGVAAEAAARVVEIALTPVAALGVDGEPGTVAISQFNTIKKDCSIPGKKDSDNDIL